MKPIGWQGEYPSAAFDRKRKRNGRSVDRRIATREIDPSEFDGIDETVDYELQAAQENEHEPVSFQYPEPRGTR